MPLVVVGAVRCGGSGKTSLTIELANVFHNKGLRVAIMVNWLLKKPGTPFESEVKDENRKIFFDEAQLIKSKTKARVFATTRRLKTWKRLSSAGEFDVILSDDGFQDPALQNAIHVVLCEDHEKKTILDLLPVGRYRETSTCLKRADLVLFGPAPVNSGMVKTHPSQSVTRKMFFPRNLNLKKGCVLLSALGNNAKFKRECQNAGLHIIHTIFKRDHSSFTANKLRSISNRFPGIPMLMTEKDYIKIDLNKESLPLHTVSQKIIIPQQCITAICLLMNTYKTLQKRDSVDLRH